MENKNKSVYPLIGCVLIIFGVLLGIFLGERKNPKQSFAYTGKYASKMADIMQVIDRHYVDTINQKKLFKEAVTKMMHRLDPHSTYIPAERLKQVNESIKGRYGGVGIRFTIFHDTLDVVNVIPNSPSSRVGIQKFDQIIAVNGKNIAGTGLTNKKVRELLKGEAGVPVNVKILREGEVLNKKIVRGSVPMQSIVAAYMMTNNVGYIRLSQFSMTSGEEFYKVAHRLKEKGMKKLIFDLRYNGGGVLGSAVKIVEAFLKKGTTIVTTKGRRSPKRVIRANGDDFLQNVKVAILINSATASASEITAGAIQDNDRGIIVGRRSFGKGLVQRDFSLKDGSDLRLTIARYYTPTGRCIQKPYKKEGYKDYIMDEYHRMKDGELYHVDSSVFVDSLKFYTPEGQVVYGGGGIMPDVFVPLDTSGMSAYYGTLRYHHVFRMFSYYYVRKNPLDAYQSIQEFDQKFKVDKSILQSFNEFVKETEDIPFNKGEYKHSLKRIKTQIKAEIARQKWLENGAFYIINQDNKDVLTALKALND